MNKIFENIYVREPLPSRSKAVQQRRMSPGADLGFAGMMALRHTVRRLGLRRHRVDNLGYQQSTVNILLYISC